MRRYLNENGQLRQGAWAMSEAGQDPQQPVYVAELKYGIVLTVLSSRMLDDYYEVHF